MKLIKSLISAITLLVATSGVANATLLGIAPSLPDLQFNFVTVDYDATTDQLTATLNTDGSLDVTMLTNNYLVDINAPHLLLTATINASGSLVGTGSLSLIGSADTDGDSVFDLVSTTLLSGNISEFGFDDSGTSRTLDMRVTGVSGGLSTLFSAGLGIIVTDSGFNGDWTQNFNSGTASNIDITTPKVPVPGTLALMGLGIVLLAKRRK